MIVKLMQCNDLVNEVYKSPVLIQEISYTFVSDDILRPRLQLNMRAESLNDLNSCNYFYIPETGRYYFVTDEISVNNGKIILAGKVDVLYTWASHISSLQAIVARNEYLYNTNLNDGDFRVYQNPIIKVQQFPSGFSRTDNSYILVTNGKG